MVQHCEGTRGAGNTAKGGRGGGDFPRKVLTCASWSEGTHGGASQNQSRNDAANT